MLEKLILEFSQFLSGPAAGLRLSDLGANVIKIERPGSGDLLQGACLWGRAAARVPLAQRQRDGPRWRQSARGALLAAGRAGRRCGVAECASDARGRALAGGAAGVGAAGREVEGCDASGRSELRPRGGALPPRPGLERQRVEVVERRRHEERLNSMDADLRAQFDAIEQAKRELADLGVPADAFAGKDRTRFCSVM